MPLLKKKPIDRVPVPDSSDVTPKQEVYQIRFTGEIFTDYEQYFARYNLYRHPIWTCEATGRTSLTYEEALMSEHSTKKKSPDKFPEAWKPAALNLIHYNTVNLADLTDQMYEHFKSHIFLNEIVTIEVESGSESVKVTEILTGSSRSNSNGRDAEQPPMFYRVRLVNSDGELLDKEDLGDDVKYEWILPASSLRRDRQVLSKVNFKKFIKDVATKDVWVGAPWIVRSNLLKRYNISKLPPPEVPRMLHASS
ncbi:hypothetical protein HK102_001398 [Quaeritorhiza haematococci]|nr:hypothetical protein HK102_001398 [Quaeritorhiza haematococci]